MILPSTSTAANSWPVTGSWHEGSYSADVELPWEPHDGGVIAPFRVGPNGFTDEHPAGELSVDRARARARGRADWRPA